MDPQLSSLVMNHIQKIVLLYTFPVMREKSINCTVFFLMQVGKDIKDTKPNINTPISRFMYLHRRTQNRVCQAAISIHAFSFVLTVQVCVCRQAASMHVQYICMFGWRVNVQLCMCISQYIKVWPRAFLRMTHPRIHLKVVKNSFVWAAAKR